MVGSISTDLSTHVYVTCMYLIDCTSRRTCVLCYQCEWKDRRISKVFSSLLVTAPSKPWGRWRLLMEGIKLCVTIRYKRLNRFTCRCLMCRLDALTPYSYIYMHMYLLYTYTC